MEKVFISHSSKDKPYVKLLVDLLEGIGLSENEMVCSSVSGYGIPLGNDIYEWLSEQFGNCKLHIIFVLSTNYYESVACLNEMGAAWVLKQKYDILLLPGFDFQKIEGAINPQQIGIKLDSDTDELKQRLNELKDSLIKEFNDKHISDLKWERKRDEFINNVAMLKETKQNQESEINTYEIPQPENRISKDALILLIYAASDNSGQIIMSRTLSGLSVYGGKYNFIRGERNAREEARWSAAVEELEDNNLIADRGYKHEIFEVTNDGYQTADKFKDKLNIDTDNSPDKYLENK